MATRYYATLERGRWLWKATLGFHQDEGDAKRLWIDGPPTFRSWTREGATAKARNWVVSRQRQEAAKVYVELP